MANTYKNIIITPNRDTDAANVPVIRFSGGDATTNTDINVRVYTSQSGTLSFEGSAGQLFSITNDLTNSIFSVNDVSGIPSIDVYANGDILLAPFGGQVFVGNTANLNFDSTASTKIVDPAANTLAFHTAQTERMRIDNSGNVLIGRTTSTVGSGVKLDVAGAANASNILVNGNMVFTAANDGAGSNLDADLLDGQQGSYYLANTAGISTAGAFIVPGVLTANAGGSGFLLRAGGTADHVYISYYPRSATGSRGAYVGYASAGTNTFSIINETTTGSLELGTVGGADLTIDAAGEVGIGRSDPGYKLDVVGTANASNILVNGNMALTTQNFSTFTPTLSAISGLAVTDSNFIVGNGTTWVAENGATARTSLGLGTIATQAASSVSITGGSITGITDLTLADGGTNASLTASAGAVVYSTASALALSTVGSSGQVLTSGATGAPTWTAQSSLAAGTFSSTSQNSQFNSIGVGTAGSGTAGEIRATNNITAYYSDKRLKKNIKQISFALDKVNKISGVTFQSNEEAAKYGYTDKKTQVGVIAQEIEAVLPEVVVPAPFDIAKDDDGNEYSKSGQDYKTVQYEKLVPLLIEAIKELSGQVADLQNQIQELKK